MLGPKRVLTVAFCAFVVLFSYEYLLSQVQSAVYGPVCERECEARGMRYQELWGGRRGGLSVAGCKCALGSRTTEIRPRFYVDLPVVDGFVGFLVGMLELLGLFGFGFALYGVWRFFASRLGRERA
jgi:hypothetical protein